MLKSNHQVATLSSDRFVLDCRGRRLDCRPGREDGAIVMGILNVTPDSFYDGGRYESIDDALRRAEEILREGAAIVDVGGESSRPRGSVYGEGAAAVATDEEKARVVPVVEAIVRHLPELVISVDTHKAEVAKAALDAGAHLINDITALRFGPELAQVAAKYGAPVVLMHSIGRPGDLPHEHHYENVVADVKGALAEAVNRAERAGVRQVVVDPGFGFGKSVAENLRLVGNVDALLELDRPVLVGISRKSTIGSALGSADSPLPIDERLSGSLGATAVAVMKGATLVRTHDVRPTVHMLRVLGATVAESGPARSGVTV